MQHIYLLLFHTHTRVSEFIRFMTRYPYSHVAIAFEESCSPVYSFGRRRVDSILDSGLSIEEREGEFFRVFPHADCIIYRIEVTDEQFTAARELIAAMERDRDRYKYDFLGIALRYLGLPIAFPHRFVCSQFVAHVLESADIYHFDRKACMIRPKGFYALPIATEIYRGKYLAWQGR